MSPRARRTDAAPVLPELAPRLTRYIPHRPTPHQGAFLLLDRKEAFYGGAAGGGKSDALLMAALQYVDVPGYAALLLRRTYDELEQEGSLIPLSKEWFLDTPRAVRPISSTPTWCWSRSVGCHTPKGSG